MSVCGGWITWGFSEDTGLFPVTRHHCPLPATALACLLSGRCVPALRRCAAGGLCARELSDRSVFYTAVVEGLSVRLVDERQPALGQVLETHGVMDPGLCDGLAASVLDIHSGPLLRCRCGVCCGDMGSAYSKEAVQFHLWKLVRFFKTLKFCGPSCFVQTVQEWLSVGRSV